MRHQINRIGRGIISHCIGESKTDISREVGEYRLCLTVPKSMGCLEIVRYVEVEDIERSIKEMTILM